MLLAYSSSGSESCF